jgi:hypothetical protein
MTNRQRVKTPGRTCGEACHNTFNPLGFARELRRHRHTDDGPEAGGRADSYMFDGQRKTFTNGVELSQFMADAKETHACYVQNMMSYLHGRQPTDQDKEMVDYYARLSRAGMLNLRDMELTIVTSDAFLNRLP